MKWWFKITASWWPVYVANESDELAKRTLDLIPGGHIFGPYPTAEAALRAADGVMAADEAAMGGG